MLMKYDCTLCENDWSIKTKDFCLDTKSTETYVNFKLTSLNYI